ncbi:MAG TPA: glycosyltransferase family A protein [Polyangia bacterium]
MISPPPLALLSAADAGVRLSTMRISVVVPVLNGGENLLRCLQGLASSARQADEIIVVDDGSTDGSVASAIAFGARIVTTVHGPRGPAHARNRGAEAATGDVLAFVDADVVVHPDTLGRMESVLAAEPELAALFGSYDDNPPARSAASLYKNLLHHYVHQHGEREAGTFWAGCSAIRRGVFLAVGAFDEVYCQPSIEDIHLGVRLRQAGQRVWLCRDIQATHLKRWTLSSLWRTDVFFRAIPWTRLILQQGRVPSDLNLDWRSRLSALCAWSLVGCAFAAVGLVAVGRCSPWPVAGAVGAALAVAVLNRDLFSFFRRHGGVRFAMGAAVLHFAYLLYSSVVFAILLVGHKFQGRRSRGPTNQ